MEEELPTYYNGLGYALVSAAARDDVALIRRCLDAGADINFEENLALRGAAFTGRLKALQELVERGADLHAKNDEALFYAAKRGDLEMTKFLLDKGASVEAIRVHHKAVLDRDVVNTLDQLRGESMREQFARNSRRFKRHQHKDKKSAYKL